MEVLIPAGGSYLAIQGKQELSEDTLKCRQYNTDIFHFLNPVTGFNQALVMMNKTSQVLVQK